jgi:hypothetical protein
MFSFSVLDFGISDGLWFCLFELEVGNWGGSLFTAQRTEWGEWYFDFLYSREWFINIKEQLVERFMKNGKQ